MTNRLFKSGITIVLATLVSRISGFIRDMVVAQIFGATAAMDAFYLVFRIPNFIRNLFIDASQAFVPIISDYREHKRSDEIQAVIRYMTGNIGLVLLIFTVVGMCTTKLLVHLFAPGLDFERFQLASKMLCIVLPYLCLVSLSAFSHSILDSYGQFWVSAFNPALLNICLIASTLFLSYLFLIPVKALAWGVLAAGFIQLSFQLFFLNRLGLLGWPRLGYHHPGVQRAWQLMLPALLGSSLDQLGKLLSTVFNSFLPTGGITWLYYSDRLIHFPLGVIGVTLATVSLPQLSRHYAANASQAFSQTIEWGFRCNLLFALPAMVSLLLLSSPLITTLFHSGKFTEWDIKMTQASVLAYAIGLPAFMLNKLLTATFYSQKDTRTPVKIGMIILLINMLLNTVLILPLSHVGLALAASLSAWLYTILLAYKLHKTSRWQLDRLFFVLRLLGANTLLGTFFYFSSPDFSIWLAWNGLQRLWQITQLFFMGSVVYILSLLIFGIRIGHFRVYAADS